MPCAPLVLQVRLSKHGGRYKGKKTIHECISSDCMNSKSTDVISGPFVIFSGYLLQSWHRTSIIFPCLLHDRRVAKWRIQVRLLLVTIWQWLTV